MTFQSLIQFLGWWTFFVFSVATLWVVWRLFIKPWFHGRAEARHRRGHE